VALTNIIVEPLGRQHDRAAFHCGAEALDRYLKQQARQDARKIRSLGDPPGARSRAVRDGAGRAGERAGTPRASA
jgi:hypothetical protein